MDQVNNIIILEVDLVFSSLLKKYITPENSCSSATIIGLQSITWKKQLTMNKITTSLWQGNKGFKTEDKTYIWLTMFLGDQLLIYKEHMFHTWTK